MNYSIILPILLGVFIFLGFVFGFFRGTKKTLTRLLLLVLVAFLTGLCSINFIPYVLEFDLARFGLDLGGSTNLKEFLLSFLTNALSEAQMTMTEAQLESLTNFVVSLVSMLISGVLFLVLFVLFKILSMPVYWIINSVLSEVGKGRKKRRFLGALVGVVLGFFLFSVTTLPLTGYLNVVNTVNVATTTETQKGVISSNEMIEDIVYDGYLNNGVYGFMDKIGVVKLQKNAFNKMTTVSFNDGTVTTDLDTEAKAIAKLYNDVLPIVNKAQSGEGITEADRESITKAVQSLTEVKVFKALRQSAAVKGFSGIASNAANTAISGSGVVLNVEPIINDVFDFLTVSDDTKFSNGINSVIALTFGIMSLTTDGSLETIDFEALENLGASFDSVISNEIIKASTIKTFTTDLLDAFKPTIEESVGEGANLTACLDEIKLAIAGAESLSFKSELKAIGKVYEGILSVIPKDGEESSLDGDGIKELGVKLDEACNCGSALIKPAVLNVLTAEILKGSNLQETEFISVVFDDLVSKFESKQIVSFANEFEAIAELMSLTKEFENLEDVKDLSLDKIGSTIDTIVSYESVLFERKVIDDILVLAIKDAFEITEEDEALPDKDKEPLDKAVLKMLKPLEEHKIVIEEGNQTPYTKEFTAINDLLGIVEYLDGGELDKESAENMGKTIDVALSYESKCVQREIINDLIVGSIDEFFNEEDGSTLNGAISEIKTGFGGFKEGPYENEFKAIAIILDEENSNKLQDGIYDLDGAIAVGELLDDIVECDGSVISYGVINKVITENLETYVGTQKDEGVAPASIEFEENERKSVFNSTIGIIKERFASFNGLYVIEFNAIGKIIANQETLQNGINNQGYESTLERAEDVGVLLDNIIAKDEALIDYIPKDSELDAPKVIDYVVLDTLILSFIDETFGTLNDGDIYYGIVNDIKLAFGDDHIVHKSENSSSYVNEFTAIGELISLQNSVKDNEIASATLVEIGQKLDKATKRPNVKSIKVETVNTMICKVLDNNFESDDNFTDGIEEIKKPFNNTTGVEQVNKGEYTKEFTAFANLVDFKDKTNVIDSGTAIGIGEKLDVIISPIPRPKAITYKAINIIIDRFINDEEKLSKDTHFDNIKTDLNFEEKEISKTKPEYAKEFSAISYLLMVKEKISKESFEKVEDAKKIGEHIDDSLEFEEESKLINKTLINKYIRSVVRGDDIIIINDEGSFKNALNEIKEDIVENLDKIRSEEHKEDEKFKYTYETEFGHIAYLLSIAKNESYSKISITDSSTYEGLADELDNNVAMSCLVGASGIEVIRSSFVSYSNNEGKGFGNIIEEIDYNLVNIKGNGNFGIKYTEKNANKNYTYSDVIDAIEAVHKALTADNADNKIVGKESFTAGIASEYEQKLYDLEQYNILISVNGARAIASYLVDEAYKNLAKEIDSLKIGGFSIPKETSKDIKDKVKAVTDLYAEYYNSNLENTDSDYYMESMFTMATFNDDTIKIQQIANNIPETLKENEISINKPFEAILERFIVIKGGYPGLS